MQKLDSGGGGGRRHGTKIVIEPDSLRRGATGLRDATGELQSIASYVNTRSDSMPVMPEGMAGAISSELKGLVPRLGAESGTYTISADELDRRAYWTDIADMVMNQYAFSDQQLTTLMSSLKDGKLAGYVESWQADAIGEFIGRQYSGSFHDVGKLTELSEILRQNEGIADFDGGFIRGFGAANLVDVPRVIQAAEYARPLSFSPARGMNPSIFWSVVDAEKDKDDGSSRDWSALLMPFSQALAVATYNNVVSRSTEKEIADDPDAWSTAQLLHEGTFGKDFLLACFQSSVVKRIQTEAQQSVAGSLSSPTPEGYPLNYYNGQGDALPSDPKVAVLEALARNPEAAAQALTDNLGDLEVVDRAGIPQKVENPLYLLYDHGDWGNGSDDGVAFSHAYSSAVGYFQDGAHDPRLVPTDQIANLEKASNLTLDLADRTVHSDHRLDPMTDALAADLGDHHLPELFSLANAADTADPDGGRLGAWDPTTHRIVMPVHDMRDVLAKIADRTDADNAFLEKAAAHQAEILQQSTQAPPQPGDPMVWAEQVGAFDGVTMNAHGIHLTDQFNASSAKHKLFFTFLSKAAGLAAKQIPVPGVDIVTGPVVDQIDKLTAPQASELAHQIGNENGTTINQMRAAITSAYYANGQIPGPPAEFASELIDANGQLHPYTNLTGFPLDHFNEWARNSPEVQRIVREPTQVAENELNTIQHYLGQ